MTLTNGSNSTSWVRSLVCSKFQLPRQYRSVCMCMGAGGIIGVVDLSLSLLSSSLPSPLVNSASDACLYSFIISSTVNGWPLLVVTSASMSISPRLSNRQVLTLTSQSWWDQTPTHLLHYHHRLRTFNPLHPKGNIYGPLKRKLIYDETTPQTAIKFCIELEGNISVWQIMFKR